MGETRLSANGIVDVTATRVLPRRVYEAVAEGPRRFTLGRTDGAPLPCAVGLAVIEALRREGRIDRAAERGPRLREELACAPGTIAMLREVRGHGFLLAGEHADPRDGESFLPAELGVAARSDTEPLPAADAP